MTRRVTTLLILAIGVALGCATAAGSEEIAGPVMAEVVRVIDGDTLQVRAEVWLGTRVATLVRIDGIDAPELRGACAGERELARRARRLMVDRVAGARVALRRVRLGKYAGRVLADVAAPGGLDLGTALIDAGLARAYRGGRRQAWCPAPALTRKNP